MIHLSPFDDDGRILTCNHFTPYSWCRFWLLPERPPPHIDSLADCRCNAHFGGLTDPSGGGDPFVNLTFDPAKAGAATGTASVDSTLIGLGRCQILPECSLSAIDCRFDFKITVHINVDPLFPPSYVQFRDGSTANIDSNGNATSGDIIVDDVECDDTRRFWLIIRNAAGQAMGGAEIQLICDRCNV